MEKSPNKAISLDQHRCPVLSNQSYIDEDGWMRNSRSDGSSVLFWVPRENRRGFWWPQNTAIICHAIITQIDFIHFAQGDNWVECHSEVV